MELRLENPNANLKRDGVMSAKLKIRRQRGTSLIELMIAMLVLGVGLLGSAAMTAVSIKTNMRSKNDSTSTAIAQAVLGEISSVPLGGGTTNVTMTDCAGNASVVNTTGTLAGVGATLTANGTIDYTQAIGGVPAGYRMQYTACNLVNGQRAVYDVRWNITTAPNSKEELVVVGARFIGTATNGNALAIAPAVNLRTVVGNQGE